MKKKGRRCMTVVSAFQLTVRGSEGGASGKERKVKKKDKKGRARATTVLSVLYKPVSSKPQEFAPAMRAHKKKERTAAKDRKAAALSACWNKSTASDSVQISPRHQILCR
jgi:hypothetical protein